MADVFEEMSDVFESFRRKIKLPSGCFSYPYACIQMLNASFFIALNQFYDRSSTGFCAGDPSLY